MRRISILAALLLLATTAFAQTDKIDWDADIDYLAEELPKRHYNLYAARSPYHFLVGIQKIKDRKAEMTDYQIALELQRLVASFGDSHTMINYRMLSDKNAQLPLVCYEFADGIYILQTTRDNAQILGHRIVTLNDAAVETVIDSLATIMTLDNQSMKKIVGSYLLPDMGALTFFGFSDGKGVELGLEDPQGNATWYLMEPAEINRNNRVGVSTDSVAFCDRYRRELFKEQYFPVDRIYYLLYNQCNSREIQESYGRNAQGLPYFSEFEFNVFRTLDSVPVDKIIFDLRNNGGGSSRQGTEFIEKLGQYLSSHPETKVYVVLGRSTFSSAILNAMDFKRLGMDVVFVGEETSGKPNHFGEVRSFTLPSSQIPVQYSTKYFERSLEDLPTIAPDVKIETGFSDFVKGVDPVYEWIVRQ